MDILNKIESHLLATKTPPSKFGREICNDPRLVFDLRRGRRLKTPLRKTILGRIDPGTKRDHLTYD